MVSTARLNLDTVTLWFIFDIAIKSMAFLGFTAVIAWQLRHRSAAMLHRLWVLAFCSLMIIPLLSPVLPTWSLAVLPHEWNQPTAPQPMSLTEMSPTPSLNQSLGADMAINDRSTTATAHHTSHESGLLAVAAMEVDDKVGQIVASQNTSSERSKSVASQIQEVNGTKHWARTSLFVLPIWLMGFALCCLRIVRDQLRINKILAHSEPLTDDEWCGALRSAAQALQIVRSVELRKIPAAFSPMITGIIRPVIIVPDHTRYNEKSSRQLVLLHEMAHLKRGDIFSQTVAQWLCAAYWFNPFAWYGMGQLRKYRELACDDVVLELGQEPSEYAQLLLEVARQHCQSSLSTTVCMARRTEVHHRILAILDHVRSHIPLSPRAARSLLVLTTIAIAFFASMRLQSRVAQLSAAEEPDKQVASQKKADKPTDHDNAPSIPFRKMVVSVKDEQGMPVPDAGLKVSVWEITKSKRTMDANKDYQTDQNGRVEVTLPDELFILRMFLSPKGYVPIYVNMDRGRSNIGPLLPQHYEFVLQKGSRIGGRLVNRDGQPIVGARVSLGVEQLKAAQKEDTRALAAQLGILISESDTQTTTDDDGRWTFDIVPAESSRQEYEFRLRFEHRDYGNDFYVFGGDQNYVGMKKGHGVTLPMIRSGDTKIVMERGQSISGTVTNTEGKPVKTGAVSWKDWLWKDKGDQRVELNDKGEFQLPALGPGEYPVTVIAPGMMAESKIIKISEASTGTTENFRLKPGKRLAIRIVDARKKPIPNARVSFREWRQVKSADDASPYIPAEADENGLFVWEGAPEDAVKWQFSAGGYASQELAFVPRDAEHLVTLSPDLKISGRVTDAQTGKPVRKFSAIPVIVFRPQFLFTDYHREVHGVDGRYSMNDVNPMSDDRRFQVRIEADGYRTALSEKTIASSDGKIECDFILEPARALGGRVVDMSGGPVANAVVIPATPSILPQIHNNTLESDRRLTGTDRDGRFEIAATFEPTRLRIVHDSGFAEISVQIDEAPGTVTLMPWSKLSGTLKQQGKPIINERISFVPIVPSQSGVPRFQGSYSVQTDSDGNFEFSQLPPVAGIVGASLGPWKDSVLTSSHSIPLNLEPGRSQKVSLGGEGATLTGQVIASGRGDVELNKKWSINWLIRRTEGIELPKEFSPLGFDPKTPFRSSWHLDPQFNSWLNTRDRHFVKLSPEGDFTITGVPVGEYDLSIQLYEQPEGCLVETIGTRVVPIVVTEADVAAEQKRVGAVDVECRVGPRIGQNMQAYHFVDTAGQQLSIQKMKGQHVLLHVWASWCRPCLDSMPAIRATMQDVGEKRVTFVGLNIDDDPTRAKELVDKNEWNWSQNYLGGHSDMARQLAISTVPTYYLINPEGLLITSTNDWTTMQRKIQSLK